MPADQHSEAHRPPLRALISVLVASTVALGVIPALADDDSDRPVAQATLTDREEHSALMEQFPPEYEATVVAAQAQEPEPAPAPEPQPEPAAGGTVWDRLADCESGDWNANSVPIPGTARWDYGLTFSHGDIFEGGLNFHPQTWEAYKDPGMPGHAGHASRAQQIAVAERVLADQGWGAWPVCSRKIGLR